MKSRDIIFAVSVWEPSGDMWELAISDQMDVYYKGVTDGDYRRIKRQGVKVNDFVCEMEDITLGWSGVYGEKLANKKGGWMVILEEKQSLRKWEGYGEHPANWDEFCRAVASFLEK
jgi:hypothetical protein